MKLSILPYLATLPASETLSIPYLYYSRQLESQDLKIMPLHAKIVNLKVQTNIQPDNLAPFLSRLAGLRKLSICMAQSATVHTILKILQDRSRTTLVRLRLAGNFDLTCQVQDTQANEQRLSSLQMLTAFPNLKRVMLPISLFVPHEPDWSSRPNAEDEPDYYLSLILGLRPQIKSLVFCQRASPKRIQRLLGDFVRCDRHFRPSLQEIEVRKVPQWFPVNNYAWMRTHVLLDKEFADACMAACEATGIRMT